MRAFDLSAESPDLLDRYGRTINGMCLLAARRLVEAGVPFVTVFWKEDEKLIDKCKSAGGWDTHGDNFNCLKDDLLPEFDRCFSALIEDLARLGLLETTLVLVTSEMGRTPKIGDVRSGGVAGAGRDHWTHCLTDVLAGGGVQGGRVYGKSDARGISGGQTRHAGPRRQDRLPRNRGSRSLRPRQPRSTLRPPRGGRRPRGSLLVESQATSC